jgi:alpha-1,2-mannosyltransferase
VWFVPLVVVLVHRIAEGAADAATWAGLGGVLVATVAVITALPGPGVGPIPRTGLISLAPDTYLVAFLAVLLAVAVSRPAQRLGPGH